MADPKTSITLCVYVKAEDAPPWEVKVPREQLGTLRDLSAYLIRDEAIRKRLTTYYPRHEWTLMDQRSRAVDVSTLRNGSIVMFGTPAEALCAPMAIKVHHQPHHNVMTESSVHFHDEGGKKPARLLFCEFIDNSLEALRRAGIKSTTIEIHLIYAKPEVGTYDYVAQTQWPLQVRRACVRLSPCMHASTLPVTRPRLPHGHTLPLQTHTWLPV